MTHSASDVRVPVRELVPGMFVSGLDRPWTDTPFVLQGFIIETIEEIEALQKYCEFVYIDRNKSMGTAYFPDPSTRKLLERDPVFVAEPVNNKSARPPRQTPRKPAPELVRHAPIQTGEARVRAQRIRAAANRRAIEMMDGSVVMVERMTSEEVRWLGGDPSVPGSPKPARRASTPAAAPRSGFLAQLAGWFTTARATEQFDDLEVAVLDRPADPVGLPRTIFIREDRVPLESEVPRARATIERSREVVLGFVQEVQSRHGLEVRKAREVVDELIDSMDRNPNAALWLARLRTADSSAYSHSIQAAVYLTALGLHIGIRREELADVSLAGLMLDVGKMRVPAGVLHKPGKLSEAEFAAVKRHVQHSLDILEESRGVPDVVKNIVVRHHERENGSGYPYGLKGDTIGMLGRMAGLVDTFVAMTNPRPYASTISVHDALRMLYRWRGTHFHEPLVEQFVQAIGVFPVGSLVELSNGDCAIVVAHNRVRRLKPRVMLVTGPDKQRLTKPTMLDLLYAPPGENGEELMISRPLEPGAYDIDAEEYFLA